jgi:hypothetical protein
MGMWLPRKGLDGPYIGRQRAEGQERGLHKGSSRSCKDRMAL